MPPYSRRCLYQVRFADLEVHTRRFLMPLNTTVDFVTIDWTYTAGRVNRLDAYTFVSFLTKHPEIGLDVICDELFRRQPERSLLGRM